MDFHTMVSQFKRGVLAEGKEEELEELTTHSRERVKKYIRDGTPNRHTPKYSFKRLFKDAPHFDRSGKVGPMRMAIPLQESVATHATEMFKRFVDQGWKPHFTFKTVTQKRQRLADEGGGTEEIKMDLPVLNMKREQEYIIPKGPRAGEKVLKAENTSLGKLVAKIGTGEDKEWWQQNQNSLREMDNVNDWFLRPWMNEFKSVGKLRPVIILTRHPIDVARMSDFSLTRSCHSEGSTHFNCAIDESKGHGMVAFLIKGEDWEKVKDKLNHDEIFADRDVGIEGIEPVARVRLRKLYNPDTDKEFATVEGRVYGIDVPDFLPTVRRWAREKQKDMWMGDDGKIAPSAIGNGDWTLIGGDYLDTQIDDQLTGMFEGTEWEEDAYEVWGNSQYNHEDYFGEAGEDRYAEAERRVDQLQNDYDDAYDQGSGYISIEEGWDDMPFYVNAGFSTEWRFPVPQDWWGSTGHGRSSVPDNWGGGQDGWQLRRDFEKLLDEAFEAAGVYQGYNAEWEYREEGEEIIIYYREDAEITRSAEEGIDEAEQFLDSMTTELGSKDEWEKVRNHLRIKFIEEEYLPPGAYQKAEVDLPAMEFKNLHVIYDEEDPYDGISIVFSGGESETYDLAWDNKAAPVRYVGTYDKFDASGENVAGIFIKKLSTGAVKHTVNAAVRAAFKRMARAATKAAEKQLAFEFPQNQQDLFGTPPDPRYQAPDYSMPEMPMDEFQVHYKSMSNPSEGTAFDLGLYMNVDIGVAITEETYKAVMLFVKYLDNHADMLVRAAKKVADDAYNIVATPAKRDEDDRWDLKSNRTYAKSSGQDTQQEFPNPNAIRGRLGDPVPVGEAKLREAIKKALMKRLVKEQTGFETRLFQVNLRIQVDPGEGGGIEQKLNRIRAIEGVTVVSHDELQKQMGRQIIEARIKFHPESDALRPGTYVSQILVPEINSSKLVPGVKVIDIVKGTLKRLDK